MIYFVELLGYGGKTNTSEVLSSSIIDRQIKLNFNADVNDSINWLFAPPEDIDF